MDAIKPACDARRTYRLALRRPGLIAVILAASFGGAGTAAADYAPLDQPGPPLSPPPAELAGSVHCTDDVEDAKREPVLLLPATAFTSQQNFGSNLQRSLTAAGIPWCTSDQPEPYASNMDDLQRRTQYVTYAIRHVHTLAGRRIAVVGHSQGGAIMRAALRFWPDTRAMVEDVVGIAATNHGSEAIRTFCTGGCSAALRQQAAGAQWQDAVNSGQETFPEISYTEISTTRDEMVTPAARNGVSAVSGPGRITNVAIQDICPAAPYDHLTVVAAPVTWELLRDAVTHDGPARPSRIDPGTCGEVVPFGATAAGFAAYAASSAAFLAAGQTYPKVPREPDLACWTTATCTGSAAPELRIRVLRGALQAGRRSVLRVQVDSPQGDTLMPVSEATVALGRIRVHTDADGRARIVVRARRPGRAQLRASRSGCRRTSIQLDVQG